MKYPTKYSERAYVKWHEWCYPADAPLRARVDSRIRELKKRSRKSLEALGHLLSNLADHSQRECGITTKGLLVGEFDIPIVKLLGAPGTYGDIFKSVDSTIEKMWRSNGPVRPKHGFLRPHNLTSRMGDLVRTSVVAPTFYHARDFSRRLPAWRTHFKSPEIREHYSLVGEFAVDNEAKWANGYFAYHAQASFTRGLIVEIQVYSRMSSAWRVVSHHIYEKTRLGDKLPTELDSPESRFISLGHLLHLADCQFADLVVSLK